MVVPALNRNQRLAKDLEAHRQHQVTYAKADQGVNDGQNYKSDSKISAT
jgi:hypothetical protein